MLTVRFSVMNVRLGRMHFQIESFIEAVRIARQNQGQYAGRGQSICNQHFKG